MLDDVADAVSREHTECSVPSLIYPNIIRLLLSTQLLDPALLTAGSVFVTMSSTRKLTEISCRSVFMAEGLRRTSFHQPRPGAAMFSPFSMKVYRVRILSLTCSDVNSLTSRHRELSCFIIWLCKREPLLFPFHKLQVLISIQDHGSFSHISPGPSPERSTDKGITDRRGQTHHKFGMYICPDFPSCDPRPGGDTNTAGPVLFLPHNSHR